MGPDEDHYFGSNNAFTNVMAAYNLFFGEYVKSKTRLLLDSRFPSTQLQICGMHLQ